jgi:conjugal transfer pilus assembly protein TraB
MINLPTKTLKRKQLLLIGTIVGCFSCGMVCVAWALVKRAERPVEKATYKGVMLTGTRRLSPQEVWAEKLTSEQEIQGKRLEALEKLLESLVKQMQMLGHPIMSTPMIGHPVTGTPTMGTPVTQGRDPQLNNSESAHQPKTHASDPIQEVRNDVQKAVIDVHPNYASMFQTTPPEAKEQPSPKKRFRSNGIHKITVTLNNAKSRSSLKSIDNTIPAGAFAKAVLLGGVDASTSIQASQDPRPVLLRFLDPGTLPRRFKSDLEGCHALAATYGDISSERVFMRLEKLSCVERRTGEVIEIPVQGYIAGEDGRAGVRGVVVDRAGENMRNAMIGGFVGSMGNFLGQKQNPMTFTASGFGQAAPLSTTDMLKSGAAKGASGALEKYADFYIKRAEQMQPVIQVAAGRVVDIVFTQGTAFGDSAVRGSISKVNDQTRLQQIQSIETKPQTFLQPQQENH